MTNTNEALNIPAVADYFTRNPHRLAACRALLDLLGIPLPDWAARDISGRAAATRNTMAAFRADNPETLHQATVRKVGEHTARVPANADSIPNGPPSLSERIAALKAPQPSAQAPDDTDPLAFLTA